MEYNVRMEKITTAIIGGGASGLLLACLLSGTGEKTVLFERGERVGRKLSATGNGQGNVTNLSANAESYFSSTKTGEVIKDALALASPSDFMEYLRSLGLLLISAARGRVYPAGRQASAVTDALRSFAADRGTQLRLQTRVTKLERENNDYIITLFTPNGEEKVRAETVVLCAGGKAAKNFGTDGTAYALVKPFGHTITPLYPSLVQLKTETAKIKTWKGIRTPDIRVTASWAEGKEIKTLTLTGDVIFTDFGVSGDAVFRLSAFVADKLESGNVTLTLDFLPDFTREQIVKALYEKRVNFSTISDTELLCGMVNNQIARTVMKLSEGEIKVAAKLVKAFPIQVVGSLGFDYAQVTKGGIPLSETDENLQSKFVENLYFAGEILDVDGQCGGYNLQWAYASAKRVAMAIAQKTRGQV